MLIQKSWGKPLVCDDGVTIAKEIELADPEENLGAQMLRQAAERTGDVVGDGTSSSTILAHAIFAVGVRNVVAGASAIDIKRGLDRGTKSAIAALKALSRPVATRKEKAQVAAISAHNDDVIGELVADAMEKVGGEGVITVEESKTTETVLEVVEGLQFDGARPNWSSNWRSPETFLCVESSFGVLSQSSYGIFGIPTSSSSVVMRLPAAKSTTGGLQNNPGGFLGLRFSRPACLNLAGYNNSIADKYSGGVHAQCCSSYR